MLTPILSRYDLRGNLKCVSSESLNPGEVSWRGKHVVDRGKSQSHIAPRSSLVELVDIKSP